MKRHNRLTESRREYIVEQHLQGKSMSFIASITGLTIEQVDIAIHGKSPKPGSLADRLYRLKRDEVVWVSWEDMAISLDVTPGQIQVALTHIPWPQERMIKDRLGINELVFAIKAGRPQRERVIRFIRDWSLTNPAPPTYWKILRGTGLKQSQLFRLFSPHGDRHVALKRLYRLAGVPQPQSRQRKNYVPWYQRPE